MKYTNQPHILMAWKWTGGVWFSSRLDGSFAGGLHLLFPSLQCQGTDSWNHLSRPTVPWYQSSENTGQDKKWGEHSHLCSHTAAPSSDRLNNTWGPLFQSE